MHRYKDDVSKVFIIAEAGVNHNGDIELAKKSTDENPVFYVQYAHARACSILRNAVNDRKDTQTGKTIKAPLTKDELDSVNWLAADEKIVNKTGFKLKENQKVEVLSVKGSIATINTESLKYLNN